MTNKEYKNRIIQKFKKRNIFEDSDGTLYWQTYNDQLNTRLLDTPDAQISRADVVTLEEDEYPLYECNLPNGNYFLMTTHHVYSYFRKFLFKKTYQNLKRVNDCTYFIRDAKPRNKVELYVVECKDESLLFFEIDGDYPAYYVLEFFRVILDQNL